MYTLAELIFSFTRRKQFERILAQTLSQCGGVFSRASSRVGKENSLLGAKVGAGILPKKEQLFFSVFETHMESLTDDLPKVIDSSLISAFPPLRAAEKAIVEKRLVDYFDLFRRSYESGMETRVNGKTTVILHRETFQRSLDSKVESMKSIAKDALERGMKNRLARHRYERMIFWEATVTGFLVGTLGSLLAQYLWVCFF